MQALEQYSGTLPADEKGRPLGSVDLFMPEPFLLAAEILMQGDEAERALAVLENLPARYREHPPAEITKMREDILASLVTPHAYASVDLDCKVTFERGVEIFEKIDRAKLVKELVQQFNADKVVPHIVDLGPGEYWLPIGLQHVDARFTYHDVSLLKRSGTEARYHLSPTIFKETPPADVPVIFCAFELIEHLPEPRDIVIEAMRHCKRMPDYAFISTPTYTFDGNGKDWRKPCGMAHLRAYTPQEFIDTVTKLFPAYEQFLSLGDIMTWRGKKRG